MKLSTKEEQLNLANDNNSSEQFISRGRLFFAAVSKVLLSSTISKETSSLSQQNISNNISNQHHVSNITSTKSPLMTTEDGFGSLPKEEL